MSLPETLPDASRLARAAALAAGAAADTDTPDGLLAQLGPLIGAAYAAVVLGSDDTERVLCTWTASGSAAVEPLPHALRVVLHSGDRVVGAVDLRRQAAAFTAGDRLLAELVSPRAALLVERHRLVRAEAEARASAAEAIERLRQKEARFEAIVDGAFELLGLTTRDGLLLEVNRAALELVGTSKAEVIGQPFWGARWWAHDPALAERVRHAVLAAADGATLGFEVTHITAGGDVVDVDFSARPIRGAGGVIEYVLVEGRDITSRRREHDSLARTRDALAAHVDDQAGRLARAQGDLEDVQALHRAVVETMVDGIVVIDEHGIVQWANTAAERLFGYTLAELSGRNVSMLMPAADADQHDGYLRRYLATGERRVIGIGREVRGRRKDGSEFPLSLAVGETTVNGARRFTGVLRDLTETKRLEQLLQERQTLARIGELASVVAHEVRNPLAAIRGVVEVIQTRFPEDSPDRRVLGDLLTRVDSLDHLVGDLLVYARPTPPVFRRAHVLALVRDTAALVAMDPAATPTRFDVSGDDAELWLDPAQMGRAVLNLLTNAAQAMRQGGVVRVTGTASGDRYQLTFSDDGPGMPEDVRARCFEPFFTTKTRGTGLGLPIAKRVVDEHGGALAITSVAGHGTTVSIELPIAAPAS